MKLQGLRGAIRGKQVRTTNPDTSAPRPLDRVNRQFKAERPNFTYVSTWQGWLYVAFVIDVFPRRIVGWRVSSSMTTAFVLDALGQALYVRQPGDDGTLIPHSDRGLNTSAFGTANVWPRRVSSRPSAAVATATITRWPKRSTVSTRRN